jgi:hypothetical protein
MPPASSPIAGTRNGRALKPLIDHGLQNHRVVGDPAAAARDSNGLAGILPRTSLASSASTAEETSAIVEQRNLCLSLNINGFTGVSLYMRILIHKALSETGRYLSWNEEPQFRGNRSVENGNRA